MMYSPRQASGYPHILLVFGDEVVESGDYRATLRDFLYDNPLASQSPVRRGTHDFWVTYVIGSSETPNYAPWLEDMTVTPRPMRGIIEMGNVPQRVDNVSTVPNELSPIRAQLATLLQELGHHWLVPRELLIDHSTFWPSHGGLCSMPGAKEVSLSLNGGEPVYGPLLLGRDDVHWSAFLQGDASAIDGLFWQELGTEDGYNVWRQSAVSLPSITPTDLAPVELPQQYNDLDLLIMGVKTPQESYSASANQFKWLEPRLTIPLAYHAGLCIAFSQYDYFYFGFYKDHRKLGIQRTGGEPLTGSLPGYHPLLSDLNNIALRISRYGEQYVFEARLDNPSSSTDDDNTFQLLVGAEPFRTIGTFQQNSPPQAIGIIVKTWNSILCHAIFQNFELRTDSNMQNLMKFPIDESSYSQDTPDNLFSNLSEGSLSFHRPSFGASMKTEGIRAHIIAQYLFLNRSNERWPSNSTAEFTGVSALDHWQATDQAPRILTKAPSGDFVFATSARIHRSAFSPWAAGDAVDKTMWGNSNSATTNTVTLSQARQRKQIPPVGVTPDDPRPTYKIAFILIARQQQDITSTEIQNVDIIRRYWDTAFNVATLGRRNSSSNLE